MNFWQSPADDMEDGINKPVFVVGSPRSGTSILTWCLGQHPKIIPLEESDWMGDLAIDLAIYYQLGTSRGYYSLLSSMDVTKPEFFSVFGSTINDLILRHDIDLERKRWREAAGPTTPEDHFNTEFRLKRRWVDGTPEYSFHICGLRKLFPQAVFIHIFRDVSSVVRSMLHFHDLSGGNLVASEQEAYGYWLRTVRSCLLAERAYGPQVVYRLRHSDLVQTPEAAFRSLFDFLNEPYASECLEPLAQRINSSNVPADFRIDLTKIDPGVLEQAMQLCQEVEEGSQPNEASTEAVDKIEAAFDERVKFVATLTTEYRKALQKIARLKEKNQQITAQMEKLAKGIKEKKAVIERLRGGGQHYKWLRSPFRTLHESLRRGDREDES